MQKIINPKLSVVGYIAPTDTMTLLIPDSTWSDIYDKDLKEYSGTFDSDIDVNLYVGTEQDCIEKYNLLVPILEKLLDDEIEDEGIIIGVYKNGDNSVLFASDIDCSQGNVLLYSDNIIPANKIIDIPHFNPERMEEDYPEVYEKVKGIFHTKWD